MACITSSASSPPPCLDPPRDLPFPDNPSFHRLTHSTCSRPLRFSASQPLESFPIQTGSSSAHLAFVYGTLKQGFGNHWLMEELMASRHALFLGESHTARPFPLVCGPFQVPFLLHTSAPCGHLVKGELYQVDDYGLARLDELEGINKGHYERLPIDVVLGKRHDYGNEHGIDCGMEVHAQAYFACRSYGSRMASCAKHISCYTAEEASTYVRRKDRPSDRTFLEHVFAWIDQASPITA